MTLMGALTVAPALAGLGLGLALAGAPGPVQAVLMAESLRGGAARGFRAMAGANGTFAALLLCLALGLSLAPPSGPVLRIMKVAGGALLVWLALDGLKSGHHVEATTERRTLPPAARGALAVLLNPGGWLFLGAVASPLFASAARSDGRVSAVLVALALVAGIAVGDGAVVVLGGVGVRRAGEGVALWIRRALAGLLAGLGVWLVVSGVIG